MNFKFGALKIILTIVIAIVLNTLLWFFIPVPSGIPKSAKLILAFITIISPTGLYFLVPSLIIIFVIWSLIQKK
jgi:hypothetical protein